MTCYITTTVQSGSQFHYTDLQAAESILLQNVDSKMTWRRCHTWMLMSGIQNISCSTAYFALTIYRMYCISQVHHIASSNKCRAGCKINILTTEVSNLDTKFVPKSSQICEKVEPNEVVCCVQLTDVMTGSHDWGWSWRWNKGVIVLFVFSNLKHQRQDRDGKCYYLGWYFFSQELQIQTEKCQCASQSLGMQ